jgi:hypothetical protein
LIKIGDDNLGHLLRRHVRWNARAKAIILLSWRKPIERFDLAKANACLKRVIRRRYCNACDRSTSLNQIISASRSLFLRVSWATNENNCGSYDQAMSHSTPPGRSFTGLTNCTIIGEAQKKGRSRRCRRKSVQTQLLQQ